MAETKKTGATPLVEGPAGSEILGVTEVRAALVKLRDGYGKEQVKLAIVIPGGDVLYLDDKSMKKATSWAASGIKQRLGLLTDKTEQV